MTLDQTRPLPANLRRLRSAAGLTVVELARRTGVARATLTQIEAGTGNPTLETLYALANVLRVPLSELIAEAPPPPEPRVLRRGEGRYAGDSGVEAWLLHRRQSPAVVVELYALLVHSGGRRSPAHPPGTWEHLHVHSGRARVGPVDRPLDVDAGDYAEFPADVAHLYRATGAEAVTASLLIVTPTGPDPAGWLTAFRGAADGVPRGG